jgi:pimeloyl-ACP methyl ester carboxylesterase
MASKLNDNPWETTDRAELVSIGTHSLYVSTSGPRRCHAHPVCIYVSGSGSPCAQFPILQAKLSEFIRVYFYDRAGYDRSELPPLSGDTKILATDTAHELHTLMAKLNVAPPYILVAHSYGGWIVREYLHHYPDDVAGMVTIDCSTEAFMAVILTKLQNVFGGLCKDVDFDEISPRRKESGLTDEQYRYFKEAEKRTEEAGENYEDPRTSMLNLMEKHQLDYGVAPMGDKPLHVFRCNFANDIRLNIEEAKRRGSGTEEQYKEAEELLAEVSLLHDQLLSLHARLSRNSRYEYIEETGHDMPSTRPRIIADRVRAMFETLKGQGR